MIARFPIIVIGQCGTRFFSLKRIFRRILRETSSNYNFVLLETSLSHFALVEVQTSVN